MEMTIKRYGHVNIDEQRPAVDLLDAAFPSTPGTEQRCLDRRARRDSNPNLLIRSSDAGAHMAGLQGGSTRHSSRPGTRGDGWQQFVDQIVDRDRLAADQLWGTAVRRYGQRQAPIEVAL